jgi:hypothetical protein
MFQWPGAGAGLPGDQHRHRSQASAVRSGHDREPVNAPGLERLEPTTPDTAVIAPAIRGETLKRPGSCTSTSVSSPSAAPDARALVLPGEGFERRIADENP